MLAGQLEQHDTPRWANGVLRIIVMVVAACAGVILPVVELVWVAQHRRRIRRKIKMGGGPMTVSRQAETLRRVDSYKPPVETAVCRVPGCGGHLRFYTIEFGRVVDVCTKCEQRVARAAAVEAQLRAEVQWLTSRVAYLESVKNAAWRPGLCVQCRQDVTYSGVGRIPLYCENPACLPPTVVYARRRKAAK